MDGAKRTEEGKKKKRAHVLVIPHCTHGHIIPALLLSKELVKQSIRVTFIGHKSEIDRLISEDVELTTTDLLQFVGLPRPCVVTVNPREAADLLLKSFKEVNMLEQLSVSEGPTFILSDMFNYWSTDLALQLQVPRYIFMTSGAVLASLFHGCEYPIIQGTLRVNADDSQIEKFDGQVKFLGLPPLRYHEINPHFQRFPLLFIQYAREVMTVPGILINTFYELEALVIDSLRTFSTIKVMYLKDKNFIAKCSNLTMDIALKFLQTGSSLTCPDLVLIGALYWPQGQQFFPIGPLLRPPNSLTEATVVQGLEDFQDQCIRWLNSQPESSVLYISFGTLFRLEPLQITELALGLEHSKHRFLWVLPHHSVSTLSGVGEMDPAKATSDVLPLGFEARVAERGYVVKGWAPQVQVLSHPSTGGFLTHCGWNSVLEAVSMGVTMLTWPISADQHLNCRLLVDELKVASEVKKSAHGIVDQGEVERVVRLFMEEERLAMKGRMDVLKLQAAAAQGVGGSSTYALQQLIQDIKNL